MGSANTYTDEEILDGLRVHMIDNKLSKYSFFKPMTWQGVLKRIDKDEELKRKVKSIEAEHNAIYEEMGLTALMNNDDKFNVPLFKMYAGAKKSFQTYETNELEERIEALEDES